MKKRQKIEFSAGWIVLVAAFLMLAMLPMEVEAVVCPTPSTADFDGDGFTDAQECAGITLNLGTAAAVTIPTCAPTPANRSACMDPNSKDVFVIMVPASGTLIPADPYKFITAAQSAGGLGITVHEITAAQAATDRKVTKQNSDGTAGSNPWPQLAARIQESKNVTAGETALGSCNQGIILDLCTVFTQRIVNFVNSVCVAGTTCVDGLDAGITGNAAVITHYIRHTIAHELGGHGFKLAPDYNASFGGNHNQAGSKVMMEQNVTYSKKGTKVTWYISTAYTSTDKAAARLQ